MSGPSKKRPRPQSARHKPGRSFTPGDNPNPPRRKKSPRGIGGDQVEGRHAVRELLLAGTRATREVVIAEELERSDIIEDIEILANEFGVRVRRIGRRRLNGEAATESHQGVIARANPLPEHDIADIARKPDAFLLVLDGITDPGNLGALLRTAECAGVTGVVLARHRSVHITPTVTKAAAGAIEHLPMAVVGGIPNAITKLQEAGLIVVGLDAGGDTPVFDLPEQATGPIALVMGDEGKGLSRLVRQRVDTVSAIPLCGELNSLNVAAATAVACFEVVRRRKAAAGANHDI